MRHHFRALMGLLLVVGVGAACSRPGASPPATGGASPSATEGAVRVTDVDLGLSVGPDKRVTDKTDSFSPSETIYVSVKTEGAAPSATLKARFTFQDGQVVQESSQTIAPTGTAVTEFHVSNPAGWPKGSYKVEVFLNGGSVETENFKVG
jgi:hypothetical protein